MNAPLVQAHDLAKTFDVSPPWLNRVIEGKPRLNAIPQGCAFNPRCPQVFERCREQRPDLLPAGATRAACWLHDAHAGVAA